MTDRVSHALLRALLLAVLGATGAAEAKRIDVFPGPGNPLADAIAAASEGDVLVLQGPFPGPVVVDKRITLSGPVATGWADLIDGGCIAPVALQVTAPGVRIKHLGVRGFTSTGIQVAGTTKVRISESAANDTCLTGGGVGFEVVASTNVRLRDVHPGGLEGAGIRLADLAAGARVQVKDFGVTMPTGVLIENVQPGSVRLQSFTVGAGTESGVVLRAADGVRIVRGSVSGSLRVFDLDADSDQNYLAANVLYGAVVIDDGSGNCWRKTRFFTGEPYGTCP